MYYYTSLLQLVWLTPIVKVLTFVTPTAAAADIVLVCADMAGLCAAAGCAAVLAGAPASTKADEDVCYKA